MGNMGATLQPEGCGVPINHQLEDDKEYERQRHTAPFGLQCGTRIFTIVAAGIKLCLAIMHLPCAWLRCVL